MLRSLRARQISNNAPANVGYDSDQTENAAEQIDQRKTDYLVKVRKINVIDDFQYGDGGGDDTDNESIQDDNDNDADPRSGARVEIPGHIHWYEVKLNQNNSSAPPPPPPPRGYTIPELPVSLEELVRDLPQVLPPNKETVMLGNWYAKQGHKAIPLGIVTLVRRSFERGMEERSHVLFRHQKTAFGNKSFRSVFLANIKDLEYFVQLAFSRVKIIQDQLRSLAGMAPAGQRDMSENDPSLNNAIASRQNILWSEVFWYKVFELELLLSRSVLERLDIAKHYATLESLLPMPRPPQTDQAYADRKHIMSQLVQKFWSMREGLRAMAEIVEKYTGSKSFLDRHAYELLDL